MRIVRGLAPAVVAVALLAGCSSSGSSQDAAPTPPVTASPTPAGCWGSWEAQYTEDAGTATPEEAIEEVLELDAGATPRPRSEEPALAAALDVLRAGDADDDRVLRDDSSVTVRALVDGLDLGTVDLGRTEAGWVVSSVRFPTGPC